MDLPIKLISTDFDGTLFAEGHSPPVPERLQALIGGLQARGAKWVINTGRDLASLTESLRRAELAIQPDYLVLVERELRRRDQARYVGFEEWNSACSRTQAQLFHRLRPDLPRLVAWIHAHFRAHIYEDAYSPFCLIARHNGDADRIHEYLDDYRRGIPDLTVVRNDVYARLSHSAYSKGTALAELARHLGLTAGQVFAAGDQLNDLPMLSRQYARFLAAPANAIPRVKEAVHREEGYVGGLSFGEGVAEALDFHLAEAGKKGRPDPTRAASQPEPTIM